MILTDTTVIALTDGLRWWGFLAALAGVPMAGRVLMGVATGNREEVTLGPWAGLGLLCFFLFLLVAGFSIPLANKFGDGSVAPEVALIFWLFASLAGWFLNVALAPGKAWLFATAGLLLPATMAASVLLHVP